MFVLKENENVRDVLTHGPAGKQEEGTKRRNLRVQCGGERTRDKNINRCYERFSFSAREDKSM